MRITVVDNVDKSASASFIQRISNNASQPLHTLTISTSPSGTPNPVSGGAAATLSVVASDSLNHPLSYTWSATCPALADTGKFSPSAAGQNPTWTAPANNTGAQQTCTLQVAVSDGHGETLSASFGERVNSITHVLKFTSAASGSPNPVAPGGTVNLTASAIDTLGHTLSYLWQATCPADIGNGTFAPNASVLTPTWTAPSPASGPFACVMRVTVTDSDSQTVQSTYTQNVTSAATSETATAEARPADTADFPSSFVDADNNRIDDDWEARYGLDPSNPDDGGLDGDGDELSNAAESARENPLKADTDGDAVADGSEVGNGDNPRNASDWTPSALRGTVGDRAIYLTWNGPLHADADGALLSVERAGEEGGFEALGTLALDPDGSSYRLSALPNGEPLENGRQYRLGLVLKRGAVTRQSAPTERLDAKPAALAAGQPTGTVLFVPGFGENGDPGGAFGSTLDFASRTLGWRFGGRLCFTEDAEVPSVDSDPNGASVRRDGAVDCSGLSSLTPTALAESGGALTGNFFTLDFANNRGEYSSEGATSGLTRQSEELGRALDAMKASGITGAVALVGHGTGGVAARSYLARTHNAGGQVAALVTYGAPVRGADVPAWCRLGGDDGAGLGAAGASAANVCGGLALPAALSDVAYTCSEETADQQLTAFLNGLGALPGDVAYTSIVGSWLPSAWSATLLANGGRRPADCVASTWDGFTPAASADLAISGGRVIETDRVFADQGSDIAGIFCGLNPQCLVVRTSVAADLAVIDPQGRRMSAVWAEIPGGAFMKPAATDGDVSTVILPFVSSGTYQVRLTAKPGSTDKTVTVEVTQAGRTSVLTGRRAPGATAASFKVQVP